MKELFFVRAEYLQDISVRREYHHHRFLGLVKKSLNAQFPKNLIITTVKSDITGDTVYSGPLVKLSKDMDAQLALEYVEEVFENIIDNRYSSESKNNRIQFYDELLVKVNEIIIEYVSV